jgi:hypothetical protein
LIARLILEQKNFFSKHVLSLILNFSLLLCKSGKNKNGRGIQAGAGVIEVYRINKTCSNVL